ncbi:MAG: 50S ribosomal protein L29 [Crocinitomicaceae bacterium]|nr:50S ribosomal protein L29 [Crocinitomicaceae bacterium]
MKAEEIKKMSESDLLEQIKVSQASLAKMKFSHTIAGSENPMILRHTRRNIAKMLTELNSRNNNSK